MPGKGRASDYPDHWDYPIPEAKGVPWVIRMFFLHDSMTCYECSPECSLIRNGQEEHDSFGVLLLTEGCGPLPCR